LKSQSLFTLLSLVGFVLLFFLVLSGASSQIDTAVFVGANSLSANAVIGASAGFITLFGNEILLAFMGLLYYLLDRRENVSILLGILFAIAISDVLLSVLKGAYFRPRPYQVLSNVILPVGQDEGSSFPSGHATRAFAVAAFLFLEKGWKHALFFLVSTAVATSRVLLGLHFPTDVLAGALLGIVLAWATLRFLSKYVFPRIPRQTVNTMARKDMN